jgi:2-oxoglutarate dehydrogenase E2 component (dihydrolipoamide succinyltransferase)
MFFSLPDLGIDDQPITVSMWLVKEGRHVRDGEPVLELLCGGITVDLPAPEDGVLAKKLVVEGDELTAGQQLAEIETV